MLETLFRPWEIEQISCVDAFVEEKGTQLFEKIRWGFDDENPKFENYPPPRYNLARKLPGDRVAPLALTIELTGIEYLQMVMFDYKDHDDLVSIMEDSLIYTQALFLRPSYEGALGEKAQEVCRETAPSPRDQMEQRRDPLPFRGDTVNDPEGMYPPLGWTLLWRGTYSNVVGCYIGDETGRWGYALWDSDRLMESGAAEVLASQLRIQWWGWGDPRQKMDLMPMNQ
ncbi:hypothetical protein FE257_007983 [Aspergillus nanangensis]|uniref:Uncharacterized protein n=1 Tax=Aspergillus nanangensis TaxID=2582783 RepID=A0AAD4CM80_ASPNN|nr:hypothetical protein FE257_007983 [Aspergillus nanangensis]